MIVDSHVHVGTFPNLNLSISFDEIIEIAERMKIDKVFCTHLLSLFYDFEEGDRLIYEGMKKHPEKIFSYITVTSPRHGSRIIEHIKRCYFEYGFHGIKIYSHPKGVGSFKSWLSITDEYMYPIYDLASQWKVPVLAHSTPAECNEVCSKYPELRLLMAHMGNTQIADGNWHKAIMVAKEHKNLYLDTTNSGMDFGMIEEAVKIIGAKRIIWGSDMPLLDSWFQREKILAAEILESEKKLILGENTLRLITNSRP